jgi:hypothetical protein
VIAALAATVFLMLIGGFLGTFALLRHSEAQRSRAEANYQVASRSLDDLLSIFANYNYTNPFISLHDNRLKTLEIARSQEIELSKRYPLDIGGLKRLASIDGYLTNFYVRDGKRDKAQSLMEESIDHCEACLALSPGDVEIQQIQFKAAIGMLNYISNTKDDHFYEQWNARTTAMLERSKSPDDVRVGEMSQLSSCHHRHADYLMWRGDLDRARKELEADLDRVRSFPGAEAAFPKLALSEALTLAALGQWSGESTPLRFPIHPRPANLAISDLEPVLAELTATRIGWLPSIVKSPWLIPEDLPTEAWTDRVISSIQSDATKFDLDQTRVPAIGWMLRQHSATTMTWQRKVGKLGDAHRIADQLVALAERLTRSYPDQAAAYMLLSEGYAQKAKNAYREEDDPVIERWERKALDAAKHAATLEPENDEARNLVKDRHARLDKLISGK